MFTKLKYSELLLAVFIITVIKYEGMDALKQISMEDSSGKVIQLYFPQRGSLSSGILKSHIYGTYYCGDVKNLTLSAPKGYSILAAIRMLDLRPNNQDKLTLFDVKDSRSSVTYSNPTTFQWRSYDSSEFQVFTVSSGQLGVSFATSFGFSFGFDGFELTYTVFSTNYRCKMGEFRCSNKHCISNVLTCDGHNHCGDRSDQSTALCYKPSKPLFSKGKLIGTIFGSIFLLIAIGCSIFKCTKRATRSSTTETTILHPPSTTYQPPIQPGTCYPPPLTYQPPTQPGTCYPPPPPPYFQYPQGQVNPAYQ